MDICKVKPKSFEGPLRIPILDKSKEQGTILLGKVESGILLNGMKIVVMPGNVSCEVQEIYGIEDLKINYATPGMNIRVKIRGNDDFKAGNVVCDPYDLPTVSDHFLADVMVLDLIPHKPLILPEYKCMIHIGVAVNECTFQEIIYKYDHVTKKKVKAGYCTGNTRITARIKLKEVMCVETFCFFSQLGRFTLRDEDITIGLGKILEIL